jgi:hypothetical protein
MNGMGHTSEPVEKERAKGAGRKALKAGETLERNMMYGCERRG